MVGEILNFENRICGYKIRLKELHFSASKNSTHKILDEFSDNLNDFEDTFMEGMQGLHGQFKPGELKPVMPMSLNPIDFVTEIRRDLLEVRKVFNRSAYAGEVSVLDDFLHKVNVTLYLLKSDKE